MSLFKDTFSRIPDLEVHGLKSFYRPESIRPIGGLLVDGDRRVWYTVSAFVTVECPFVFDKYPMDEQVTTMQTWVVNAYRMHV